MGKINWYSVIAGCWVLIALLNFMITRNFDKATAAGVIAITFAVLSLHEK